MTNIKIEQLLQKPQGDDMMHYQNLPHTSQDLAISISAIANTDGGHIIFGIKKHGNKKNSMI